jgi:4-hydroxy-4-methyl-2-oxoglutarate aldolase
MSEIDAFSELSPTSLADVLTRAQVMNLAIHPLWSGMPRIAGPAYTVKCTYGDNLMLHAAIYRAPAGSVIVVESGDVDYAVAGGNVCAVAQQRGIAAFVVDGVIRDLSEIRQKRFPVFARGVSPIPGGKRQILPLNAPVHCGGVQVAPGDIVVADEEGIIVIPQATKEQTLKAAQARVVQDRSTTLEAWEQAHKTRIDEILKAKGFQDEK